MISFSAAQSLANSSNQVISVTVDGSVVGTITPGGTGYASYSTGRLHGHRGHAHDQVCRHQRQTPPSSTRSNIRQPIFRCGLRNAGADGTRRTTAPTIRPARRGRSPARRAWPATAASWGNPTAPEGSQVAFLQNTGSVSQAVTLAAGNYVITFSAAQRTANRTSQTIVVTVDGTTVGTITPTGTSLCQLRHQHLHRHRGHRTRSSSPAPIPTAATTPPSSTRWPSARLSVRPEFRNGGADCGILTPTIRPARRGRSPGRRGWRATAAP